jgi:hypothetical protein
MTTRPKTKNQRPKSHLFGLLFSGFGLLFAPAILLRAQGILPPAASTQAAPEAWHPLLIGEKVPESLVLVNENGERRSLLSYKSPTDVMVVTFFSNPCESETGLWPQFRRLYGDDKGWGVAFLAVTTEPGDRPAKIPGLLKQEQIPWPVLHDGQKTAAAQFRINETPTLLIIDEFGILRYRGPLKEAQKSLDRVIGHTEAVQDPEPPSTGGCAL